MSWEVLVTYEDGSWRVFYMRYLASLVTTIEADPRDNISKIEITKKKAR